MLCSEGASRAGSPCITPTTRRTPPPATEFLGVEPDWVVQRSAMIPDDPLYPQQWFHPMNAAPEAWAFNTTQEQDQVGAGGVLGMQDAC
jgi:hypothetical protein